LGGRAFAVASHADGTVVEDQVAVIVVACADGVGRTALREDVEGERRSF
jgi:hypothetical protein